MRHNAVSLAAVQAALIISSMTLTACARSTPPAPPSPPATDSGAVKTLSYPDVLELAQSGNHDAEFELGAMFHDGDGVEQDDAKALMWYKKAAAAGNRQAAFNLGLMFKNGEGTDSDPAAARRWFIRASDTGDARATLQLGTIAYATEDYTKALPYFLKAAKKGLAEAQMNAGVMYIRAEGMPAQDAVEGYAWLKLAKEGGSARAASMVQSLSAQMAEDQRKSGEERAVSLRTKIKKAAGPNAGIK